MKKIRKVCSLVGVTVILALAAATLGACDPRKGEGATLRLVAPDGATALAIAQIIADPSLGESGTIQPEIVSAAVIKERALQSDLAVVPANVAAIFYNSGKDYRILGTVSNGNLYMIGSIGGASELEHLVGKLIYSIGQGSVPDLLFQSMLNARKIPYRTGADQPKEDVVSIKYVAEAPDAISAVMSAKNKGEELYAVVGEPAVGNAIRKGAVEIFDLQALWQQHTDSAVKGLAQAVLIAKTSVCTDAQLVKKICDKFVSNGAYLEEASIETVVASIKENYPQSSLSAAVLSKETIARCNLDFRAAQQNGDYIMRTLQAAFEANPKSVGGKLPDQAIFYSAQ